MVTKVVSKITVSGGLVQSGTSLDSTADGQALIRDAGALTFRPLTASDISGGISGGGTVTSVAAGTGLTASPSPITGAGTVSLTVPVAIVNGGTASTTAAAALTALGAVPTTRTLTTTGPLTGGGDLSANRTLSVNAFTTGAAGVVPASGGGTTNFLRADGTWAAPPGGGGSGTVTSVTAGTGLTASPNPITATGTVSLVVPVTIANGGTGATSAGAALTALGGVPTTRTVSTTAPLSGGGDLSADRTLSVSTFTTGAAGIVPASGGGTSNFLRADGTWASPPGSGGYQPLDGDLTSLAAASATNAIYYRSAADTWTTVTIGSGLSFSGGTLGATSSTEVFYRFDATGTTMVDPGSGKLRFNNSTLASATAIAISKTTDPGVDISTYLKSLVSGDQLYIQDQGNSANWLRFILNATPTNNTSWFQLNGSVSSSAGAVPSNNSQLVVVLQRSGGAGGGTGTVTNVATGTGLTGGPITTTGTISLATPVSIANGGTGGTSASSALANLGAQAALTITDTSTLNLTLSGGGNLFGDVNGGPLLSGVCGLRLTTESGTPVSTTDRTAQGTVYLTFSRGNQVVLYDGTTDRLYLLAAELSCLLSDATKSPAAVAAGANYDLFAWDDAGTVRLSRGPAWSSDTARGTGAGTTELEYFNGRLVNKQAITNGPAARRGTYVGSLRGSAANQTEDSELRRFLWSMYQQAQRQGRFSQYAPHTYASSTYRQWNADSTAKAEAILGQRSLLTFALFGQIQGGAAGRYPVINMGIDATNAASMNARVFDNSGNLAESSALEGQNVAEGYHSFAPVEVALDALSSSFNSVTLAILLSA